MATQTTTPTLAPAVAQLDGVFFQLRPFSLDEYKKLIEIGIVAERDGLELVDGHLEMQSCYGSPDHVISAMFGNRPAFLRRFSIGEFDRMLAAGMFDDRDRIELLEGMIVQMPTQKPPHSVAIRKANQILSPVIPEGWIVQFQLPISSGEMPAR